MAKSNDNQSSEPVSKADLSALKAEIIEAVQDTVKGLATKDDLKALATQEAVNTIMETLVQTKEDMTAVKEDMKAMEDRLSTRLDRIEHLLLAEQKREIEDLQKRMKRLEDALAV